MPANPEGLTERQRKWFASVRGGLERDTGRSLEAWVAIARTCPETKPRARLAWFKAEHGLMQNRASYVLSEAFRDATGGPSWSEPDALEAALWTDAESRAAFERVREAARALPDVVTGQRKGYTAWSRKVQFAACRPTKGGGLRLGLAVPVASDARLQPRGNESWSERLHAKLDLASTAEVNAGVQALLRAAWEAS